MDKKQKIVLVDCRSEKEMAVSGMAGAVTKDEFSKSWETLAADKDTVVVAFCAIGGRSGKFLKQFEADNAAAEFKCYNLAGSVMAWLHAGEFLVDGSGAKTTRVHGAGEVWLQYFPS